MERKIIKRLKTERARRFSQAVQKLLEDDDLEAAKKNLAWIDTSSKLISLTQRVARVKWTIIIAFVCLSIVLLAWTLPIPSTHISLEAETENVSLVLRENWSSNDHFISDEIVIDNIVEIKAPGLNLVRRANPEKESTLMRLQGKEIIVNNLKLLAHSEVELGVKDNELRLFIKGSPLTGELHVQNADIMIEIGNALEKRSITASEIPETITFETANRGAVPVLLRVTSQEDWRLSDLQVEAISFSEECPPGLGYFESAIRSGRVTVLETGFTKDLLEADCLTLKEAKSRRLELSRANNSVKVFFEGSVAKILAGPKGFEDNLTPTWFEYIYHRKPLAIFWSAVAFLFGITWRIRSTFFS